MIDRRDFANPYSLPWPEIVSTSPIKIEIDPFSSPLKLRREYSVFGNEKGLRVGEDPCSETQQEVVKGTFKSLWRSVAFMMNFSVVLQLATLVAFAVTILGGKQKRDKGWRVICGILVFVVAVQCASMAIVVSHK